MAGVAPRVYGDSPEVGEVLRAARRSLPKRDIQEGSDERRPSAYSGFVEHGGSDASGSSRRTSSRAIAIAMGATGERDSLSESLDELRPYAPDDEVASKLVRLMVTTRGSFLVDNLAQQASRAESRACRACPHTPRPVSHRSHERERGTANHGFRG